MFSLYSSKGLLQLLALISIASLLIAWAVMQQMMRLEPCPLCILDRIAISIVVIGCFLKVYIQNKLVGIIGFALIFVGLLLGLASTIRHVWLEHNPESVSCLFPSQQGGWLAFVLDAFAGTSDCATVSFSLMGVSLAEMTLALFVLLTGCAMLALLRR